jgi:vitamin B12 transporter
MTISLVFLAAAAAASPDILVTASRTTTTIADAPLSATVIDQVRIDALGAPLALDLLRLSPGVSVSVSGSPGNQTQIRLRGAEANHTLVFIDGIAFTDPAAGNEARFETFASDGLARIEIVRGPQSALWGSEALGGVIALDTPDPFGGSRLVATGEYGSHDSGRGSLSAATGSDTVGLSATATWLRSDGIDIIGGGTGDRDGFENVTASLKAVARPGSDGEIGIVGRYIDAKNQFDGSDPFTFLRADTLDNAHTETGAVRAWAKLGLAADAPWSFKLEGQYLKSENTNRDGTTFLNATTGDRFRVGGQIIHRMEIGGTRHQLIAAIEREDETFTTHDDQFGGFTDQRRTRGRNAYVGEWQADWGSVISTDVAVRHDDFTRFTDETTLRAGVIAKLGGGFSLYGNYGEGISQPTFYDLYGFFPGSFVGNPNLTPESSKGYEAGARYEGQWFALGLAAFSNRLTNEIVSTFDPNTFLSSSANATGRSRRRGIEANAEIRPIEGLRIAANYTYLKAEDQRVTGAARLHEVRRPKHSGNLYADWTSGRFTFGGSLAYVGNRTDQDFDLFPAATVTLHDYVLASARVAYRVVDAIELFGRVENAGDARYQDVVGYATPGRTFHAGVRVRLGD